MIRLHWILKCHYDILSRDAKNAFLAYEMLLWHNNSEDDAILGLIIGGKKDSVLQGYS